MASQTQQRSQPTAQVPSPSPTRQLTQQERDAALLAEMLDKTTEYVPFMSKETIRLTPRMVQQFLCSRTKKGHVCDERQAARFVMLCKARGLNPWEGDAYLVGYDSDDGPTFSLITAHQAFLKRAETHPEYDGMESGVMVQKTGEEEAPIEELIGDYIPNGRTLVGGWAKVYFKHRKVPMYKRLAFAVFNSGYSRWKKDPAGMIVKCAESDALRSSFPNTLGGMYLDGEMPQVDHIEPPKTAMLALPTGRTSLKAPQAQPPRTNGNGHTEPHSDMPQDRAEEALPESRTHEREPGDDTDSDGDANDKQMLLNDLVDDITARIGQAERADDLGPIKEEIANASWIGTAWQQNLNKLVEGRVKKLNGSKRTF